MKVAFTGASGSGKTTLVKFVASSPYWDLPWINGSSGQLKTADENKELSIKGLAVGKGHLEIIQSGHKNPEAAIENQHLVLYRRAEFIKSHERFVTDRSPIDNWVYYLLQCSMYQTDEQSVRFLNACKDAAKELTHIIFVPTMFEIEDNSSRITNFWFQQMVSNIFHQSLLQFMQYAEIEDWKTQFLMIGEKNLIVRKDRVTDFLNG